MNEFCNSPQQQAILALRDGSKFTEDHLVIFDIEGLSFPSGVIIHISEAMRGESRIIFTGKVECPAELHGKFIAGEFNPTSTEREKGHIVFQTP